jgi:hypothetical protein
VQNSPISSPHHSSVVAAIDPAIPNVEQKSYFFKHFRSIFSDDKCGSGDGIEASIYGEMTPISAQKIMSYLTTNCGMNQESIFLDIGHGRGINYI